MLLAGCAPEATDDLPELKTHVGSAACAECHADQFAAWQGSHHDLAMQPANADTVLGDFDDARFDYAGIQSTFYARDGYYFVRTDGADGDLSEYRIAYTFGVEPLQQYLVEFPDGRIQALSICWDTRPAIDGGQRWFHLYPDEAVTHRDVLHWTKPSQNWNFMCAECHSTKLQKNYDASSDTFATAWREIDVSCEACHGPGSTHVEWAQARGDEDAPYADSGIVGLKDTDSPAWPMNAGTGIAARVPARTSNTQLETCARCHARRSQLSEDYVHGNVLLDTHRVSLLDDGLYHADGQILDEVYVYGSFIQSTMHTAGVTCTNCHEPHSLELIADGNGVCAQCHASTVFDTADHHHHEPGTSGSACVDCHMASRNYMVIDARRDHSFRVPRPDLTDSIGTPNACNGCHEDQTARWAGDTVAQWHGPERSSHFAAAISAGRTVQAGAAQSLHALIADDTIPAIVRATALTLLPSNPTRAAGTTIERATRDGSPLIRTAAAEAAAMLQPESLVPVLGPLLSDPVRAVRHEAVASLLASGQRELSEAYVSAFDLALNEYRDAQLLHADRAESQMNIGLLNAVKGDLQGAVESYRRAIAIEPQFVPSYINLADLYRQNGRESDAETILRRGLDAVPDSAELNHALGLSLVRQRRYEDGLEKLQRAFRISPSNARYAYVLAVGLHSAGQTLAALDVLREAHEARTGNRDVLLALTTISRDAGQLSEAIGYAEKLAALDPGDTDAARLLRSLRP